MGKTSGNDIVSLFDIEDEIDMWLASQGTTSLEVASNPKDEKCVANIGSLTSIKF